MELCTFHYCGERINVRSFFELERQERWYVVNDIGRLLNNHPNKIVSSVNKRCGVSAHDLNAVGHKVQPSTSMLRSNDLLDWVHSFRPSTKLSSIYDFLTTRLFPWYNDCYENLPRCPMYTRRLSINDAQFDVFVVWYNEREWFQVKTFADVLRYKDSSVAVSGVAATHVKKFRDFGRVYVSLAGMKVEDDSPDVQAQSFFVDEHGLYQIIRKCNRPIARALERTVARTLLTMDPRNVCASTGERKRLRYVFDAVVTESMCVYLPKNNENTVMHDSSNQEDYSLLCLYRNVIDGVVYVRLLRRQRKYLDRFDKHLKRCYVHEVLHGDDTNYRTFRRFEDYDLAWNTARKMREFMCPKNTSSWTFLYKFYPHCLYALVFESKSHVVATVMSKDDLLAKYRSDLALSLKQSADTKDPRVLAFRELGFIDEQDVFTKCYVDEEGLSAMEYSMSENLLRNANGLNVSTYTDSDITLIDEPDLNITSATTERNEPPYSEELTSFWTLFVAL